MLVLGVDTSGKQGSIALVEFDKGAARTLEVIPLEGGTFSAQLVPQIAALLQNHKRSKHQIDAFAVVSGPGSFTGLRVGLAAVKALAEILQKPIVAMSLLDAVGQTAPVFVAAGEPDQEHAREQVFPYAIALDAGRGEVFVARREFILPRGARRGRNILVGESLMTLGELAMLRQTDQIDWVTTPDEAVLVALREQLQRPAVFGIYPLQSRPQADTVARLAFEKLQLGETVSPELLDATYLRRSEAEIKFTERTR